MSALARAARSRSLAAENWEESRTCRQQCYKEGFSTHSIYIPIPTCRGLLLICHGAWLNTYFRQPLDASCRISPTSASKSANALLSSGNHTPAFILPANMHDAKAAVAFPTATEHRLCEKMPVVTLPFVCLTCDGE